jgi:tripartite-type tricarboxylate transporter receptor subunit TctC
MICADVTKTPRTHVCIGSQTMNARRRASNHQAEQHMTLAPRTLIATSLLALLPAASPLPAAAQADAPAGKTVQMIIGFGPGGGYDLWGRTVGRHIGRHLPGNPNVVPQNMPGAGSFTAASYIYNVAPKDGSVLGIIARDAALGPLSGAAGARFDPLRLSWIGTPTKETNVCIAYHTAPVKTVQDLYDKQLILGDTGPGTGTRSYPKALSELLGMKFKLVGGFRSSADVFLAMERGEVEGICESYDSVKIRRPDWLAEKRITILFQGGAEPNLELKDVPFVRDLARTEEQRQAIEFLYAGQGIGRPFVAPPELPAARLKMLRDAFAATMKDAEFIADTTKSKLELEPEDGEHLAALIAKIYATPKPIVDRITGLIK